MTHPTGTPEPRHILQTPPLTGFCLAFLSLPHLKQAATNWRSQNGERSQVVQQSSRISIHSPVFPLALHRFSSPCLHHIFVVSRSILAVMVYGFSEVTASRGRGFILYWIALKNQRSTQAPKSKRSERNCVFETLSFLSSFVSLSNKSIFLWNSPWPSLKSYTGVEAWQCGFPGRRGFRAGMPAPDRLMDSDTSRSGLFSCRHSRPFLGRVTGAIFIQS